MNITTTYDSRTGETYSQSYTDAGTATTLLARVSDPARFKISDKVEIGGLRGAVTGVDCVGGQILVMLIEPATVAKASAWTKDSVSPPV
jgi:hypothetical protein